MKYAVIGAGGMGMSNLAPALAKKLGVECLFTGSPQADEAEQARVIRDLMAGSEIRESHREGDARVQDPYCIRCQPQVTGACIDLLAQAGRTLEIEANAATDNPLVLTASDQIVSGGNFHAEPVAFAADQIALAIAEIGAISQRRIALMVDPALSHDLPPFLTPDPGLNSGLMIAEVTSAALMSENKHLATPCSTDSMLRSGKLVCTSSSVRCTMDCMSARPSCSAKPPAWRMRGWRG